ncbi:MAG: hypothetical protein GX815_13620 [Clostridiales bacterium]|nr:hypothetical protein [Clostridiales bacterium]
MNKIGFIDYYIDEWHANQYVKWIPDSIKGEQFEVSYAWAMIDKPGGITTQDWCNNNNVVLAASIEELVDKSDSIIVLSPDNPEMHVSLSQIPLASGKPVYIDKTFALDLHSAVEMFDRAAKYNTPMYSTSALRYAPELTGYNGPGNLGEDIALIASKGPGHYENYLVHQLEMVVRCIGLGAQRAICNVAGKAPMIVYEYGDGRNSIVHCMSWTEFGLELLTKGGEGISIPISSSYWLVFIEELLAFFITKQPPVSREETCEVIGMVEAGIKAIKNPRRWTDISK